MKRSCITKSLLIFLIVMAAMGIHAQTRDLDGFESKEGWSFIRSDGVNLNLSSDKGVTGKAVRFDYDFTKGTGYGGIQKLFPIDLPENYEFSFYIKAESPANNFEIKFIDSTGNNVWWVNNHNYDFPPEWKKIRIKKRHIRFAWGPTSDQDLKRIDRIEFTVSSFVGGKGTLWIDDLKFEPLLPEATSYPRPSFTASTSLKDHPPALMGDSLDQTFWQSAGAAEQNIDIDFMTRREFGGLQIDWLKDHFAKSFHIFLSDDGTKWEQAYAVNSNGSDLSFVRLPEAEARFLRIILNTSKKGSDFGIREIKFLEIRNSMTQNDFLIYAAEHSPPGDYPRYFNEKASYWTITGVNNDVKEALLNEDGMVEAEKARFSVEPMIKTGDSLYNWHNVASVQSLGPPGKTREFSFIPEVTWTGRDLKLTVSVNSCGEANVSSRLEIAYSLENLSDRTAGLEFYLLLRPFQVNPYYQWLNISGGAGKIRSIREEGGWIALDGKTVIPLEKYDAFGAASFDEGNLADLLRKGLLPAAKSAVDPNGLASGVIRYIVSLEPHGVKKFHLVIPYYGNKPGQSFSPPDVEADFAATNRFWQEKTGHIKFNLPPSADPIVNTYRSNLAYILINRDRAGIQPGSRSYERSWIRDGALTSSALLKSGIVTEVKDFIDWYAAHQYENGKVPCVVDSRGPDPVPENDSHGEMICLIREYFNFTGDTAFLRSKNSNVLRAVDYLALLIAERSTDKYRNGNDSVRACFGLVPESISHEGYSAKPMHSYWDDFFTMKGLKDAAEIQKILGEKEACARISRMRDIFRENLYNSINLTMQRKHIDYIPGCAELGDFDATSTTIALTPCNELKNLPKPQVYNTFDKYYNFFRDRREGKLSWVNYTPYENRLIGSFIMLDEPERAHELISFFLHDQRPQGWNHWAEVVWKDYRFPGYVGDMPHTWVGSDFINAVRAMFVYENEYDQTLVLGAALYQDWIDAPGGMSVSNLPTYYGEVSYSVRKDQEKYHFSISGNAEIPSNGISIRNFNRSKLPARVTVNGAESKDFSGKEIRVNVFPAEVVIYY